MSAVRDLPATLPPNNLEAEDAVLGAVMVQPDTIAAIGSILTPDDFYSHGNGEIWRAMKALWRKRVPASIITVQEELERFGQLANVGGISRLAELLVASPADYYAEYYADIVQRHAAKRRLITAASKIVARAYAPDTDPNDVVQEARALLATVLPESDHPTIRTAAELVDWMGEEITRRLDPDYAPDIVPTGLYDLDRMIRGGGFQRGELVILGARPSVGKTAMGMQFIKNYARWQMATNEEPYWSLVFSAEMTAPGLMWRALSETSGLPTDELQNPLRLTDDQMRRVQKGLDELAPLPLTIDDRSAPTTEYMRETIERLSVRYPVRYVLFDYLGLAGNRNKDETQRYSDISAGLKQIAKACDVTVLALAQLNRNVDSRPNKRPILSDLRQSGQIEADADVVLGLYRHDAYVRAGVEQEDEAQAGIAEIGILKQRDGETGIVKVQFTPETTSFHSLARGQG